MVEVVVRGGDIERALRLFKNKCQKAQIFKEVKLREYFEPNGERRRRKRWENQRRLKKRDERG